MAEEAVERAKEAEYFGKDVDEDDPEFQKFKEGVGAKAPDGWTDVLGSGAVLTKAVTEVEGDCPEYKQFVFVHYQLRLAGSEKIVYDSREDKDGPEKGDPVKVMIGDQILDVVVPGVMLAIRMIKQGQIVDAKINHRFAFADKGDPELGIGPNQDLEARIECIRIGEMSKEPVEMTPKELVESMRVSKERGNYFFKRGDLNRALRCYQDGLKKSESHLPPEPKPGQDPEELKTPEFDEYNNDPDLIRLRIDCAGNMSACFEKQEKWKEAKEACVAVLTMEPNNLKALLRASRVSQAQDIYDEAKMCLITAKEYFPGNADVKREMQKFKKRVEAYKLARKKQFGGKLAPASTRGNAGENNEPKGEMPKDKGQPKVTAKMKEETQKEKEEPEVKQEEEARRSVLSQILSLIVLLAPSIVAAIAFMMLPVGSKASSTAEVGWRSLSRDAAQRHFIAAKETEMLCEGMYQRSSCCVCLNAMTQFTLRHAKVAQEYPHKKVQVGFRMDGEKEMIPFHESETVLISLLDKVCNKLPMDVSGRLEGKQLEKVKNAIPRACTLIVDEFYDEILGALRLELARIRRSNLDVGQDHLPRHICRGVIGVCEDRPSWMQAIFALGPGYEDTPCELCEAVSKLVAERDHDYNVLRAPSEICANLKLGAPKAEERIALVASTYGDACIELIYTNRKLINSTASQKSSSSSSPPPPPPTGSMENVQDDNETCHEKTLSQALCAHACNLNKKSF